MSENLILVHGWGSGPDVWTPLIAQLTPGCQTQCLALPWCVSPSVDAGLEPFEKYLQSLAKMTGEPAIWVGWSLGGLIAVAMAHLVPQRVTGLVLIDSPLKFVNNTSWTRAIEEGLFESFQRDFAQTPEKVIHRFLALQCQDDEFASGCRRLLKESLSLGDDWREQLAKGLDLLASLDLRVESNELHQRTIFIHGQNDRVVSVACAEDAARSGNGHDLHLIHGSGHAPHVSHPKEVGHIIERYMSEGWAGSDTTE